jgi:replication factor A1
MMITNIHEHTSHTTHALKCFIKATIIAINTNKLSYPACPNQVRGNQCKKKMTANDNEEWYCAKCDKKFIDCNYSYMVRIQLQDHTGQLWATTFDKGATQLISMPTNALLGLETDDKAEDKAQQVVKDVLHK